MAKPTTRAEFIAYCKRSLGAPVVEINVDDDQLGDRMDEAIQFYEKQQLGFGRLRLLPEQFRKKGSPTNSW